MNAERLVKEIQVDPYGHEKLLPDSAYQHDRALLAATASVRYEAVNVEESYWLQSDYPEEGTYSLWFQCDELSVTCSCCAVDSFSEGGSLSEAAGNMLRAVWFSRAPFAVSLHDFTQEGLLKREWLDEFTALYTNTLKAPKVPESGLSSVGELFYDNGSLRYRGELCGDNPHGMSVGFWENGSIWCDGHFKENKPHGWCRVYFPDGTLRHAGLFSEGYPKGWGREFFNNGKLWFEGIFGRQSTRYYYGARVRERGRLYSREGELVHDGKFITSGHHSAPDKRS